MNSNGKSRINNCHFDLRDMRSILILMAILLAGCSGVPVREIEPALIAKAEQGDVKTQVAVALRYDSAGRGAEDYAQAASWYQRAADAGDAVAQNNLGSLYQNGLGVPKDLERARALYAKSAAQGFPMAENSLGYMFDLGLGGLVQDRAIADRWYLKAAEQGLPEAMLSLGINYHNGYGVPVDLVQSYMWLDLARFFTQFSKDMPVKWRCRGALDALSKEMDPGSIREGQRLSHDWYEAYRTRKS